MVIFARSLERARARCRGRLGRGIATPRWSLARCRNPDLVHYWPGQGNAEDSVGNADGAVSGATFTPGRFGQAFTFDGVDDSISFGNTAGNFGTSDFTVSYWIRTLNTTEIQGVFGKRPVCMHSSFWDNRINPSGTMNVELDQDAARPTTTRERPRRR